MNNTKKTREQLMRELSGCFVPGHGPDFTVMTDEELERMQSNIKATFEKIKEERFLNEEDDNEDY